MDWNKLNADVNCILSKHYTPGRSGKKVNKIIIHYNAGDLTVEGCYSVWQTRQASAHYQVESSGRIGQLVWDGDTAWHAGNWDANCTSIGIEHANKAGGYVTDTCLDAGAHLVAALCVYYKLGRPQWKINVFPHNYFSSTSCPGRLGDEQNATYMQRAQQWYDNMTKGTSVPSKPNQPSLNNSNPKAKTGYVEVLFNGLTIRNKPSWNNSAAAGTVKKGEVFTVVNGQDVAGVWMYQIKSGKWITSAPEYVKHRTSLHQSTPSQQAQPPKKTLDQIAKEVIAGKWGNDPQRSQKLKSAGYNPTTVQDKVNELMGFNAKPKMTARQFAKEVWYEGKHGTGAARVAAAKRLGVNYAEAQRLIDILANGGSI